MLHLEKYTSLISSHEPSISTKAGRYLDITSRIFIDPKGDNTDITAALQEISSLDLEWVKSELELSEGTESRISAEIAQSFERWTNQAKKSLMLQSAIEVACAERPKHTGNEWNEKSFCDGTIHTISNAVYEMVIEFKESQQHNRRSGISVPKWTVSWHVVINALPSGRRITCYGVERAIIAGQNKSFSNIERAEKYFDAIKAHYAHYFMDEFPHVPQKHAKHFMVNGVLLPGYSLETEHEAGTNDLQEAG